VGALLRHPACRLSPRQRLRAEAGVVAIFSNHLYTGKAPKLYGHGKPTRDYIYVGDIVSALRAASGKAGTYNVATSVETDVLTIWSELQRIAQDAHAPGGFENPVALEPELADLRPGELQHSRLDIARAEAELDWRPSVAIADGLELTYNELVKGFQQEQ
jgi:UDP-glucose 4-epimerase